MASCWVFYMHYTMMHGSTNIKFMKTVSTNSKVLLVQNIGEKRQGRLCTCSKTIYLHNKTQK